MMLSDKNDKWRAPYTGPHRLVHNGDVRAVSVQLYRGDPGLLG